MTTIVRRNARKSPALPARLIRAWGDAMLERLDRAEAELSVLLTNDKSIQKLNRDYRQTDRPTDVLSFHFASDPSTSQVELEWLLGDIVISLDTAQRQAKGRKRPLEEEVRWLLAHGILHLCGYDHDTPEQKRCMVAWTRRLVRAARRVPSPHLRRSKPTPSRPAEKRGQRSPGRRPATR